MKKVFYNLTILVLIGFTSSMMAQEPDNRLIAFEKSISFPINDIELTNQVNQRIQDFAFYGVYDYVCADVSGGAVRLTGWTHEEWIADKLAKTISRMNGVQSVDNQILRASGSDDLARRAVRAIYSDGLFEKYSFTSNPPIHVVVINNRIILAGTVSNEVEYNRASHLVDFKTNAISIDNRLQITP
jgi:osmotically-inducible protein OsmY